MKISNLSAVASRLWLGSFAYLALLAIIFSAATDIDLSDWVELTVATTILLSFAILTVVPLAHVVVRPKTDKPSVFLVAGYLQIAGYISLAAWLLCIKLKTCDSSAIAHDTSWYCNVDGTQAVYYVVAIPFIAAAGALLMNAVLRLVARP